MIFLHSSFSRALKHPMMLIFILFLLLIGLGLYSILSNQNLYESYEVRLKINTIDDRMTDVYLYNEELGSEAKFLTIADVYRDHYHATEFTDSALYIIKRTGGNEGYLTNPDWIDELWIYESDGHSKKLYSARGIDFRVMSDTKKIGIVFGTVMDETIVVMNQDGNILKTFDRTNIGLENNDRILEPLFWKDGVFWLVTRQGLILMDLISISDIDFSVFKRDVSNLNIAGHEFALDPTSKFLIFSDYISPLDVQDINNIPSQSASLYLYDLNTGVKKILLTTFANRPFEPAWKSQSTIEYNDPSNQERVEMSFPR